jgi:hypothetical protein
MTARVPVRQAGYFDSGRVSDYYVPAILWGRMASCGRVVLGLPISMQMPTRPSTTRPQVTNLPHIRHSYPSSRRFGVGTGRIGGAPC